MLNKIKYQMEKSNILVLKDLDIVYPSLYELFNRNFIELDGKKYTYLGKSQTKTLINEDFKVIALPKSYANQGFVSFAAVIQYIPSSDVV